MSLIFLAEGAPVASAHPSLVQATPTGGQVAGKPPRSISLAMSERVVLRGSSIALQDQRGRKVKLGALRKPGETEGMTARIAGGPLPAGIYRIRWVALGDDGHTVSGDFRFGAPTKSGVPPPGAEKLAGGATGIGSGDSGAESALSIAVRGAGLMSLFVLLGGVMLRRRLRGRLEPATESAIEERWQGLRRLALAVAVAAALEAVVATAAAPSTGTGFDAGALTGSATAVLGLVRLGVLALTALAFALLPERRRALVLGVGAAGALATHAVDGHTAALQTGRALASFDQLVHLGAGAVWIGGLLVLAGCVAPVARGSRGRALEAAARAFTPVAAIAALAVVVSGVFAALREVGGDYFLFWSAYGRVLLVKIGFVAILLGLGAAVARGIFSRPGGAGLKPVAGGSTDAPPAPFELSPAAAPTSPAPRPWVRRLMGAEGAVALVVIALASVLAGLVQGKGQPLPAQRGNVFTGAGFATTATRNGVVRLTLAPARRGPNEIAALIAPARDFQDRPLPRPRALSARLTCPCAERPVDVRLRRTAGGWRGDVNLPADGVWQAAVRLDGGKPLAPAPLTVGVPSFSGSTPRYVVSVADLSGPAAERCRSQQLGVLMAIGVTNVTQGIGGSKIVQVVRDSGGDPRRARRLALDLERDYHPVGFVAPCGGGAEAAIRAVGDRVPTIAADPASGPVAGGRVYRLAPAPHSEGFAAGKYIRENAFKASPHARRIVSAITDGSRDSLRRIAGLRAGLGPARVAVRTFVVRGKAPTELVRSATAPDRWAAAFLDGPPSVARALGRIARRDPSVTTTALITSSRHFQESFQVDAGILGRGGAIRSIADVNPESRSGLLYTTFLPAFVGERASIYGLRGFVAGQAFRYGVLEDTTAPDAVAKRLARPKRFSDAAVGPWLASAPAAGTRMFRVLGPTFLPTALLPQEAGGEARQGRFFTDGSWADASGRIYTPLELRRPGR